MSLTGKVIEGGFGTLMRNWQAVAAWGAVLALGTAITSYAARPLLSIRASQQPGEAALTSDFIGALVATYGTVLAIGVLTVLFWTAAFRMVLRPQDSGFAYVRLGMDELRVLAVTIILAVAGGGVMFVVLFGAGVMLFGFGAAAGQATGDAGAVIGAVLVFFLLFVVLALVLALLYIRFSLAVPLTFHRRRIVIGESWRRTRGRFWSLFAAYFVIFIAAMVASTFVSLLGSYSYLAEIATAGLNPEAAQAAAERELARYTGAPDVMMVLSWIANGMFQAVWIAVGAGAAATATRLTLTDDIDDIEDVLA